jgi:hypothetical protein
MKYIYVDNCARKCEIFILHCLVVGRIMYNLGVKYVSFSPHERCLFCRSITYWITNAEWPDIGGGEEFFTEAYEVIRNVLYNISDIFTLVILTVKVFVACQGYY